MDPKSSELTYKTLVNNNNNNNNNLRNYIYQKKWKNLKVIDFQLSKNKFSYF